MTNQLSNNVAVIATSGGLPTPAQQIQQLIDVIKNDDQISERAKSHLINKLQKALSALTDETSSANNKKLACKLLNSAVISLGPLQKSKQLSPAQAAEIKQQITSVMSNLKC